MTAITEFTAPTLRTLQARVLAALKPLEAEFGISFATDGGNYSPEKGMMKIAATVNAPDGSAVTQGEIDFKRYAVQVGLRVEDFSREFQTGTGKRFAITGMKPSASKFPVVAKELVSGKLYKFAAAVVIMALRREAPVVAVVAPPVSKAPAGPVAGSRSFEDRMFG